MARERTGASSFDELAVGLSSGTLSRGKALKLMGAALLGGTLASFGIREAGAVPPGCTRNGEDCRRDRQCCSGNCSSGGTCVGAAPGAGAPEVRECVDCICGTRPAQNVCTNRREVCVRPRQGENNLRACMRVCGGSFPNAQQFICDHTFKISCDIPECRGA